jgi:Mrp family chromosome partitioning ATPase
MHGLAERIRAAADVIILDSPPVLAVTDAAVLSSVVDGVIVVADAQRTSRVHFREGCAALAKVGAPTVGAVFNRLPASATHRPYYGGRNQARPDEPAPGERHVPAADAGH